MDKAKVRAQRLETLYDILFNLFLLITIVLFLVSGITTLLN